MYSFIRKVISTVSPWGSDQPVNDLEDEEQKIINSLKSMNTDSEDVSENTSQQKTLCGQSDTVQYDIETFKCIHKKGKITHMCDEYGLIDEVIYFEPHQVSAGLTLKPYNEVHYTAFQFKENETLRVFKIYAKNDSWECEGDDNKLQSENAQKVEEINVLTRIITGRVTERRGRKVYIESANVWCHLDRINTTFIPVEGDWVELQALVSINEESADLSGEILEIKSLKPLLSKEGIGRITFWCEVKREGAVENLIYFTNIACELGYIPNLGDEVAYQAVESDQDNFRWRAVKVHFNNFKQENRSMSGSTSIDSLSKETNDPFGDKNDITITPTVCAVELELNEKKTVIFEVTNHGTSRQILKNIKFQRKQNFQLILLHPRLSKKLTIKPGQTIQFEFQCQGTTLGLTGEICFFYFKGFVIAKRVEITVIGNKQMNELLECKFDTVFKVYNNKIFSKTKVNADQVLYGPRPWKQPRFIKKERKCVFNPPPNLWNIMEKNFGIKCIKALTDYAPYLKSGLNFEHYQDRFHLLLYLEEINLRMNFKKYDLNDVYLVRSDNYFVLEVPGLVEKRPSLIVGDKISLTQSWYDGGKVKHVGFIHNIREKEIYVKFHDSFHANYNESECDISFEPNTNFFSRCHDGVNRAVKLLGQEWLFPSSVNEKPPVIDLEITDEVEQVPENVANFINRVPESQTETKKAIPSSLNVTQLESKLKEDSNDLYKFSVKKKLVWINKKLNKRQKLAVVNVLQGTGRPLPYIIFGPPGTGKTVTLVEIIIQIYRLMPESRILVTTPSNSAADLISERLIDLGNFKPGQLLRLVAFYRVVEGLVPPKLIPYSSFYTANRNEKNSPKINPKYEIKGISPEELPGRQRIIIATCVTIGHLHYLGLPSGHFTHILVDEAGQTTEPEILISTTFQNTRNSQIVLTGDPQQLGPVVCSHVAKSFGLGVSLLQRLISTFPYSEDFDGFPNTSGFDPRFITKLNLNYRSVPEILSLPSRLFYNSDLIPTVSQTDSKEAKIIEDFNFEVEDRVKPPAIIFHGMIGQNFQEKDSPSWFNPHEIWQVVFYVRKLYSIGLTCDDIGIVTPYSKQVQKLKNLLPSLELFPPKIGSVEEFQGQERLVIIVSTVRSSAKYVETDIIHSLGFVASPQRLNVALTRARALLIIIGNPVLLSKDPYWVSVVNYCLKNKSYMGCSVDIFHENLKIDPVEESSDDSDDTKPED